MSGLEGRTSTPPPEPEIVHRSPMRSIVSKWVNQGCSYIVNLTDESELSSNASLCLLISQKSRLTYILYILHIWTDIFKSHGAAWPCIVWRCFLRIHSAKNIDKLIRCGQALTQTVPNLRPNGRDLPPTWYDIVVQDILAREFITYNMLSCTPVLTTHHAFDRQPMLTGGWPGVLRCPHRVRSTWEDVLW